MAWTIGYVIGGLIVVVVAALLLTIIALCLRIRRLARTALAVVGEIEGNTRPIWGLNTTNRVAQNLLDGAKAIEANGAALVEALSRADRNRAA
jgi:hypothetical protein